MPVRGRAECAADVRDMTDEVLPLAVAVPARLADLAALLRDTPTGTPAAE
ncbi:hypothetical protein ACIGD1_16645 [Streptomyces sp. NPDC085612]